MEVHALYISYFGTQNKNSFSLKLAFIRLRKGARRQDIVDVFVLCKNNGWKTNFR
jgi:hypothetical protein